MAFSQKFTDPKNKDSEFVAASPVEATRFRAMGYKQVDEKKSNKASSASSNKAAKADDNK